MDPENWHHCDYLTIFCRLPNIPVIQVKDFGNLTTFINISTSSLQDEFIVHLKMDLLAYMMVFTYYFVHSIQLWGKTKSLPAKEVALVMYTESFPKNVGLRIQYFHHLMRHILAWWSNCYDKLHAFHRINAYVTN